MDTVDLLSPSQSEARAKPAAVAALEAFLSRRCTKATELEARGALISSSKLHDDLVLPACMALLLGEGKGAQAVLQEAQAAHTTLQLLLSMSDAVEKHKKTITTVIERCNVDVDCDCKHCRKWIECDCASEARQQALTDNLVPALKAVGEEYSKWLTRAIRDCASGDWQQALVVAVIASLQDFWAERCGQGGTR